MATKCDAWRADTDATLHKTERDAAKHDLRSLADKLTRKTNRPLWEALADNAAEAIRLLQAYAKSHPTEGGGRFSSPDQKGPAKGPARPPKVERT